MESNENKKLTFEDFLDAVDSGSRDFVGELHDELLSRGCKFQIKAAKSGYLVSVVFDKKTIANFVFRRKGLIIRIYANHINQYREVLDTLPDEMVQSIQNAPLCKRLVNPACCNSKCAMGYDFTLRGERLQKCRNSAFMFLLCKEHAPAIRELVVRELDMRSQM